MHKYKFLLFDLDGTVTDSGPGIMEAARRALLAHNIEEADEQRLRLFVGPPLDKSFIERYGFSEEQAWDAIGAFRAYYNDKGVYENSVYPGMDTLLSNLKAAGYVVAIASSKPQVLIHKVLAHFDIDKYFDVVVGCELDGTRSNKAEVIEEVLRQLSEIAEGMGLEGGDAAADEMAHDVMSAGGLVHGGHKNAHAFVMSHSIMIGDRSYDVVGAHAFDLPCIGVLYGYGSRQEFQDAGADYICETVEDLGNYLLQP